MSRAEALVAALQRRMPEIGVKGWCAEHSSPLDVHPDTLHRWCLGEAGPTWEALLDLFGHFGADFEAEIRGAPATHTLAEMVDHLADNVTELKRELKARRVEG